MTNVVEGRLLQASAGFEVHKNRLLGILLIELIVSKISHFTPTFWLDQQNMKIPSGVPVVSMKKRHNSFSSLQIVFKHLWTCMHSPSSQTLIDFSVFEIPEELIGVVRMSINIWYKNAFTVVKTVHSHQIIIPRRWFCDLGYIIPQFKKGYKVVFNTWGLEQNDLIILLNFNPQVSYQCSLLSWAYQYKGLSDILNFKPCHWKIWRWHSSDKINQVLVK